MPFFYWQFRSRLKSPQTVVLVSSSGEVGLIPKGKKKAKPVQNGAVLKSTGKLQLGAGAQATVYCNGQFKELAGSPSVELAGVCGDAGNVATDAGYDFGEKLIAAVEMVADAKQRKDGWAMAVGDPKKGSDGWGLAVGDPKKGSDGWGTAVGDPKKGSDGWGLAVGDPKKGSDGWGTAVGDPKKGSDGWGGKGSSIRLIMPFGKVLATTTPFFWSRPANTEPYKLEILDDANKIVHTASVSDTFAQINLGSMNLNVDQKYHWRVTVSGSKPLTSNELEFEIGTEEERKEILNFANNAALSRTSKSETVPSLIEAIALENGRWYVAAQKQYAELQKKHSDNVVNMMHAAFWMRYGFKRLAEKAARG